MIGPCKITDIGRQNQAVKSRAVFASEVREFCPLQEMVAPARYTKTILEVNL